MAVDLHPCRLVAVLTVAGRGLSQSGALSGLDMAWADSVVLQTVWGMVGLPEELMGRGLPVPGELGKDSWVYPSSVMYSGYLFELSMEPCCHCCYP